MSDQAQGYLTFRVGGEWYGIPVTSVIEVLHMIALNEVPNSHILGVMTLREMVIPVLDMRQIFQLPQADFRLDTPIVAVEAARGPLGLVVDEADDVVFIGEASLTAYHAGYIRNAARLGSRMIFILDTDLILAEGVYD